MNLKFSLTRLSQNQAQYDLAREAAKISPISSKELDKYEW